MKFFLILLTFFSFNLNATTIYDSFICYTQKEMVVIHGILTPVPSVSFSYQPLNQNPTQFIANIKMFNRETGEITVSVSDNDGIIMSLNSTGQMGSVDLDLRSYCSNDRGLFEQERTLCFFGYYED